MMAVLKFFMKGVFSVCVRCYSATPLLLREPEQEAECLSNIQWLF